MATAPFVRGCSTLLAACCIAMASADAHGQQGSNQARMDAAFKKGQELAQQRKYNEAIAQFQIAVELGPGVYGANSTIMATCLNELALAYKNAGQTAKAEPLYLRSLPIFEARLGKDHLDVATNLHNVAELYQIIKQYPKAEPLYVRSLAIFEAKLGKDHLQVALTGNNLAELYRALGEYAKSEPLHQRSLKIYEAKLGKDHPSVATSLHNQALLYSAMGQYARAEPLALRSLQIREAKLGKDHPDIAYSLSNLATLYQGMGQHAKAEPLALRSLQVREATLGKDHPLVAMSLLGLTAIYRAMGQHDKAEPLALRSLQIYEAALAQDHPDVAGSLSHLATLYQEMGRHAKAESLALRSLQIREAKLGKDHLDVAESLNNLATLYADMGQHGKAEPLHQRSLQIREARLGKDHPEVARSLNNLGVLYLSAGQHALAEPLFQRSLQIREARLGKDHPSCAISLLSMAELYRAIDQFAKAEPLYLRSLQIFEAQLGQDHPSVGACLNHLAGMYLAMNQAAKAEPLYQRSLQIREARLGQNHPDVARSLNNLGRLYTAQERWPEAATMFDRSRRRYVSYFRNTLPVLRASEQQNLLDTHTRQFAAALSLADQRQQDRQIVESSAGWVLNCKGLTQDALAKGLRRKGEQEKTSLTPDWFELDRVRQAMPADAVLIEIARFGRFDFKDIQKKNLPPRYAVWLIPPAGKGDVEIIDLGPAEPIEQAVAAFRKAIAAAPAAILAEGEAEAERQTLEALAAISKLALAPMQEKIGPARQWLVSPDAALWLVPWAALPLADGSYAIEKHTIRYLISGRELAPAAEAGLNKGSATIIADPDFDLVPAAARAELLKLAPNPRSSTVQRELPPSLQLGKVARLPGARAEAEAIKPKLEQYLGQKGSVYQDRQALEGVVKRLHKPGVLVLSTHGFFLADQEVASDDLLASRGSGLALTKDGQPLENPLLRCGLLLAGCNRRAEATQADDEDGILTGQEIVSLDLEGASLVVLSACETGVGQVNVGEGVAGLRQAFQLAGARSVLATLWQISDIETARLMADFFGQLTDKKDKAEALRAAQLGMIKAHRDRHGAAHPFFWAAFTLTGQ